MDLAALLLCLLEVIVEALSSLLLHLLEQVLLLFRAQLVEVLPLLVRGKVILKLFPSLLSFLPC